jgi:hypothetical protein
MSIDDFYVIMNDLNFLWTSYCLCDVLYVILCMKLVYKSKLGDFEHPGIRLFSTAREKLWNCRLCYFLHPGKICEK